MRGPRASESGLADACARETARWRSRFTARPFLAICAVFSKFISAPQARSDVEMFYGSLATLRWGRWPVLVGAIGSLSKSPMELFWVDLVAQYAPEDYR